MNIFLESVSLDEIRRVSDTGFADGVIFSESAHASAGTGVDSHEVIETIAREFAFPVCVEVGAISSDDMYRSARELAKLSDHVVVQLPLVEDALVPMHRLSAEGIGVCATYVFNGAQAVLSAKAGASMVRISLHELDAQGQTSTSAVTEIRALLDAGNCECDVMVASPRTTTQFTECVAAGAQIVCVEPDVLRSLLLHPLTDRGLDRLLSSLSRRPRPAEQ
jgi:transaldolase